MVGAFHNVSAVGLWGDEEYLDDDVLCVGDSDEGKAVAMELARAVTGREGISAGKLRLARQLEPLTAVLISINRKYKVHSGLRITGLELSSWLNEVATGVETTAASVRNLPTSWTGSRSSCRGLAAAATSFLSRGACSTRARPRRQLVPRCRLRACHSTSPTTRRTTRRPRPARRVTRAR